MNLACIHTHTILDDGSDDIETMCRIAFEKGLESIGFSGHSPIEKKTGISNSWNRLNENLPEYLDEVRAAKKRWEGKLPVYLGLEVEFIPGLTGPADREYHEMGLDFIIGAVHYVIPPKGKPFAVDNVPEKADRSIRECYGGDVMAMLKDYFDSIAAMIRAGGFDMLAHVDLVKKNNSGSRMFSEDDENYRAMAAPLTALTAAAGIPAECNTGGMNRGKINDCYPSLWLLKLFREHGVPMVINADAHNAMDLDGYYREAVETLLLAGYTETALFRGRSNGQAVWENVPLKI